MAIRMQESPDSRDLHYGAQGGGQTFRLTAITTAGETEAQVWIYALQQSEPYFNGFIRQDIKVRRGGGPNYFTVEIEYGPSGVGGGDQPLGGAGSDGGPPTEPTGPGSDTAALKSGWSFSLRVPRLHITQSKRTVVAEGRLGFYVVPPIYDGAIGVTEDGKDVEGCDWPPEPAFTISRSTSHPVVTMEYVEDIRSVLGRPNNAPFYQRAAGEVMLLAADGQYSRDEGWSINWTFGVEANEANVVIVPGEFPALAQTIPKKGFEYLWLLYERDDDTVAQKTVKRPVAAYVEEIVTPADYSLLRIGT